MQKIFGIGLSKTGTTSLANALEILGYKTKDNMGIKRYARGDLSCVDLDVVEAFDALTDTPIPSFYRELDLRFPGSKFILTVRDRDGWLKSCKKQFTQRFAGVQTEAHKQLFLDLYGTDVFDEQRFASGYDRFVAGARDYFRSRPGDLLVLDVTAGEGWERLCPFVGRAVPDRAFPKANVTQITWTKIEDVALVAKAGGAELMRYAISAAAGTADLGVSPGGLRRLFENVTRSVTGQSAPEAAAQASHKVILRELEKLSPRIPILSRLGHVPDYAERRGWNHLWLVDPLDGDAAFARGDESFSVNVALIEDGRPIYGVVYAPARNTAYYGRIDQRAYRSIGDGPPAPIRSVPRPNAVDTKPVAQSGEGSRALAICEAIEGPRPEDLLPSSMEWHTAAADAIVRAAGSRLCEAGSNDEPTYNKPQLGNPRLIIG